MDKFISDRLNALSQLDIPTIDSVKQRLEKGELEGGQYILYTRSNFWLSEENWERGHGTALLCLGRIIYTGKTTKSRKRLSHRPLMQVRVDPGAKLKINGEPVDLAEEISFLDEFVKSIPWDANYLPPLFTSHPSYFCYPSLSSTEGQKPLTPLQFWESHYQFRYGGWLGFAIKLEAYGFLADVFRNGWIELNKIPSTHAIPS